MNVEEVLHIIRQGVKEAVSSLDLSRRGLTTLPPAIGELRHLKELYLEGNELRTLPPEIGRLANLQKLNLENNQLTSLPSQMSALRNLTELQLSGNPLPIPPDILALKNQPSEILNYNFRLQREAQRRPLNTAKLLVLGDRGVGKTSLITRLVGESSSHARLSAAGGISIRQWQLDKKRTLRLNVWDFGSQDVYYPMFRFFLTPHSLYLLMLDARRPGLGNDADYWLNLIKTYGDDSPVIVVNVKSDIQRASLNEAALRQKYPQIELISTSGITSGSINEIRKSIRRNAIQLRQTRDKLPLSWAMVRADLERLTETHISYANYAVVCRNQGIHDGNSQTSLLALMHELGEVIYFPDELSLRSTVVLKPDWAINCIQQVLDSKEVILSNGLVRIDRLEKILGSREYPAGGPGFFLSLMEKFEIGFTLPESGEFLLPSLLPLEEPRSTWDANDNLIFRYNYGFLPNSVISSFIARAHQFIGKGQYWRNGALLRERRGTEAIIKADSDNETITIQISGTQRPHRDLLRRIREQFNYVHQTLFNLEVTEEIALIDFPEQFVSYDYLLNLAAMGKETFVSPVNFQEVNVKQLLARVTLPTDLRDDGTGGENLPGIWFRLKSRLRPALEFFGDLVPTVLPSLAMLATLAILIFLSRKFFPLFSSNVRSVGWTTLGSFAGGILGTLAILFAFFLRGEYYGASRGPLLGAIVRFGRLFWNPAPTAEAHQDYIDWTKKIESSLFEMNSADFKLFPKNQRSIIREQFTKDHKHLNLTFNSDIETLEVSELERLNKFRETWNEAKGLIEGNRIEPFRLIADKLTELICQALNFKTRPERSTQSQLYGHMIDASNSAFDLDRIREDFPFIFGSKMSFNEADVQEATGLLNYFRIHANYFALFIAFFDSDSLRRLVQASPYKNNFIVLNHDQLWEILAASSSVSQLKDLILEQLDLTVVSPYETGGAVAGKAFVGRAEEEKRILEHIGDTDFVLLANRKAGKTSLINKVVPLLRRYKNYQVISCDLQAVVDYDTFYDTFYMSLEESEPQLAEEISEKIARPVLASPSYFPKLISELKRLNSNCKVVTVFDEVDALLSYDLQNNEQLFKAFRSLAQQDRVHFIFSGTSTLVKRVRHSQSPFFNFCEEIKIGLLGETAARELIVVPMQRINIKFEDEAAIVKRIIGITSRHPNMIQWICDRLIHLINENQRRHIQRSDLETVLESPAFFDDFNRLIWGEANERPFLKLIVYAMWSYPDFTEAQVHAELTNYALPTASIREGLETLEIYSILTREGSHYHFTYSEFRKFIEGHEDVQSLFELSREEVLQGTVDT